MAVLKSIKNKKFKREWVKNLLYTLKYKTKFYQFNLYQITKLKYQIRKLNFIFKNNIKINLYKIYKI